MYETAIDTLLTVIEPVCVDDADVMLGEGPREDE